MVFYFRFMAEGVFIDLVHTESEWSTTLFLGGDDVVRGCELCACCTCHLLCRYPIILDLS